MGKTILLTHEMIILRKLKQLTFSIRFICQLISIIQTLLILLPEW